MEAWYSWVQNLVFFFLFMAVIDNLIAGKNYRKYIRLFSGTVLILLVLKPLTGGLRLEESIARAYQSFVFQYQAEDLQEELLGIEEKRLEQMIRQYEEAVAVDVEQMAAEEMLAVEDCQASIDGNAQSETYGQVVRIQVRVSAAEHGEWEAFEESETGAPEGKNGQKTVRPIVPVTIGETAEAPMPDRMQPELSGRILRLRRRLETYYKLEERYVEIQVAKR